MSSLLDLLNVDPRHVVSCLLGKLRAPDPDTESAVFLDPLARPIVVGQEDVKRLVRHLVFQRVLSAVFLNEGVAHLVHTATGVDPLPVHFATPSYDSPSSGYFSR